MDEQKINDFQQQLLIEISIIGELYNNKTPYSLSELVQSLNFSPHHNNMTNSALRKLVSYGIVTAYYSETSSVLFEISEFGKYFYDKLLEERFNLGIVTTNMGGKK